MIIATLTTKKEAIHIYIYMHHTYYMYTVHYLRAEKIGCNSLHHLVTYVISMRENVYNNY